MKKFNNILLTIFSIGILCPIAAGILAFLGYIAALIIGGDIATEMCYIILKECIPWAIKTTSIIVGIGLLTMYLSKQKTLTITTDNKKKDTKKNTKKKRK